MRPKCSEFVWIQRDGMPIHVRKMDDKHLLCTIAMLRRNAKKLADRLNAENYGRIWEAADAEGMYWFDESELVGNHPTWAALQFERRIRGLNELA